MKDKLQLKILLLLLCFILPYGVRSQLSFPAPTVKVDRLDKNFNLPLDTVKHKRKKKSENGFLYGINLGTYRANRYNAQYYNGSACYNNNTHNIIQTTLIDNAVTYEAIKQNLNVTDFWISELPTNMKYSFSLMMGLYVKYKIKNSGIFLQFDFAKLTTKDVYTISYYNSFSQQDTIIMEPISGAEQRINIDLGYSHTFSPKSNIRPYIELGINMNNSKFVNNKIQIGTLEYSIEDPYASYYKINRGGVGFGGFGGAGLDLVFNDNISLIPGFDFYYTRTRMGYNDPTRNNINAYYSKFTTNYCIFIRAILNGIL